MLYYIRISLVIDFGVLRLEQNINKIFRIRFILIVILCIFFEIFVQYVNKISFFSIMLLLKKEEKRMRCCFLEIIIFCFNSIIVEYGF